MNPGRLSSQRVLTVIVVSTILLAAIAALLSTNRNQAEYSAQSPEGVIQRYLSAVVDGRNDKAAQYFVTNSNCDATDLDRSWISETIRVNLVESDIESDRAFVEVAIDISSGGPFDDYYTETHNFRLEKEFGSWKIMGVPWPLYSCEEVGK